MRQISSSTSEVSDRLVYTVFRYSEAVPYDDLIVTHKITTQYPFSQRVTEAQVDIMFGEICGLMDSTCGGRHDDSAWFHQDEMSTRFSIVFRC